jgi:GT2 family glycosyltransferase
MSDRPAEKARLRRSIGFALQLDGVAFLEEAFRLALQRETDPNGRATYLARLARGARKGGILADLAFSSEALARGGDVELLRAMLATEHRFRRFPWFLELLERAGLRTIDADAVSHPVLLQSASLGAGEVQAPAQESAAPGKPLAPLRIVSVSQGFLSYALDDSDVDTLELLVDGRRLSSFSAGARGGAMRVELPAALRGGRPHVFQLRGESTRGESLFSDAVVRDVRHVRLIVERARDGAIEGWIGEPGVEESFSVSLCAGGRVVADAIANLPRADVAAHFGTDWSNYGFYLEFPRGLLASGAELSLHVEGLDEIAWRVDVTSTFAELSNLAVAARRSNAVASLRGASLFFERSALAASAFPEAVARRSFVKKQGEGRRAGRIAVVVPVYGGAAETRECLKSLFEARNDIAADVFIVNDCTPDPEVAAVLAAFEAQTPKDTVFVHRTANGGFSEAVNTGMTCAGELDVVLLNADTVVTDGWLDRIVDAADSDERIATVTPFSNNAELCTLPSMCVTAPVNSPAVRERIHRTAHDVNRAVTADLPVAHGFCMFIRRRALDEIGLFDAATWGRGYGEEVDFCVKATVRGWRHVLAASSFVVHRGGVSFGAEKLARVLENNKKIATKYPFYDAMIQRFLADDPLRAARQNVTMTILAKDLPRGRTLHVTHGLGGGTLRYVNDLCALQAAEGLLPMVLTCNADGECELSIPVPSSTLEEFFPTEYVERFRADDWDRLRLVLEAFDFGSVHLHTALHVPMPLLHWCGEFSSLYATVHDYVWHCPRVTISDERGRYCGEPPVADCNDCIATKGYHVGVRNILKSVQGDVGEYRKMLRRVLSNAKRVFAGGPDVAAHMEKQQFTPRVTVVDHPALPGHVFAVPPAARPSNAASDVTLVAVIGAISDIKGAHQLVAYAERARERRLRVEFVVFGYTARDADLEKLGNVKVLGAYAEDELADLVAKHAPHVAFFPNEWPETYSYTLSHAFALSLWPVVTDIGVPADRVRASGFGTVVSRSASLDETLDALVAVARSRTTTSLTGPAPTSPTTWSAYSSPAAR